LKIKAAVVGFGSIGRRHCEILSSMKSVIEVSSLTSQKNIPYQSYSSLEELVEYDPDYIVIASPTSYHFEQLNFLEDNLYEKKILIEKPLFEKNHDFVPKRNKVYVGYNLRFNPLISSLKNRLKDREIWNVNIFCGSNLVNWRENIEYQESSSAKVESGGGVLLDLSHEIDYLKWIFGPITIDYAKNSKISDLDIQTDDFLTFSGHTQGSTNFQVTLNYFSRIDTRRIIIDGLGFAVVADLINNEIIEDREGSKIITPYLDFNRNDSFKDMHNAILSNDDKFVCSFSEGQEVMKVIEEIKNF
jgi:CMP-N,N'-diacetyllegionaminic acid synthase